MNLRGRNAPPFTLENGWLYVLGADALGRSILARIIVAAQNTLGVAAAAVAAALLIGGTLGLIAGYRGGWLGNVILRLADIIMSFPSLLLAVVVLYMFEPRVAQSRPRARDHPHADLPAHHARRGAGDPRAHVRRRGPGDGRGRPADRAPPHRADRPADADHRRDGRLRLRDARRIRALASSASASSRPRSPGA